MKKEIQWDIANVHYETKADEKEIKYLLDENFGTNRLLRTINVMRCKSQADYRYSILYRKDNKQLIGIVRVFLCKTENGVIHPFIGPITISKEFQNLGLGSFMINRVLSSLDQETYPIYFLVGTLKYYSRFHFSKEGADYFQLSGSVLPNELLVRWNLYGGLLSYTQEADKIIQKKVSEITQKDKDNFLKACCGAITFL